MRYPNPTPPAGRGCGSPGPRGGGHSGRDTPGLSFPNPEAKTASADGTAPARVWESRTPPPTPTTKGGGPPSGPPFFLVCHRLFFAGHRTHGTTDNHPPPPTRPTPDAPAARHAARHRHGCRRAQREPSHKHRPPNHQHTNHSFSRLCATSSPRSALSNRRCVQQAIRMSCPVA